MEKILKFIPARADPKINLFLLKAEINLIQKWGESWFLMASVVIFDGMRYIQKMLPSPFFILISFSILWNEKNIWPCQAKVV